VRKRELHLGSQELLDCGADNLLVADALYLNDLNTSESGTMTRSHIHVKLVHSPNTGDIAELLVNIVSSSSTVILAQNAKILDSLWFPLPHLNNREELASRRLDLTRT